MLKVRSALVDEVVADGTFSLSKHWSAHYSLVRASEVGVAHHPKWRRSLLIRSCRDQRFSLETWDGSKNDRLVTMHTPEHRRSLLYENQRFHSFLRGARSFT